MHLSRTISELLYEHDCVVVPGLGGFITNEEPAGIDFVQGILTPPSRKVRFNASLSDDDGLVIRQMALREHLDYAHAKALMVREVAWINERLQKKEAVNLPGVGKLFLDIENKLRFVPEETNYALESYGMPPLHFYPILRHQYSAEPIAPSKTPARRMNTNRVNRPAALVVAAAVMVLSLMAGIQYWNSSSIKKDRNEAAFEVAGQKDDADKEKEGAAKTPEVHTHAPDVPMAMQIEAAADNDDNAETAKDDKREFTPEENKAMTKEYLEKEEANSSAYIILIGCFGNEANARKLSKKLLDDGFTPYSDRVNGMKRIGVRVNCSEADLEKNLKTIQNKYNKGSWVLER